MDIDNNGLLKQTRAKIKKCTPGIKNLPGNANFVKLI